jgi:hypothetical protein
VKETRAVHEWADGARTPSAETVRRLRVALQVAPAIARVDGDDVAQAWFQGLNPQLEDRSPARCRAAAPGAPRRPAIRARVPRRGTQRIGRRVYELADERGGLRFAGVR